MDYGDERTLVTTSDVEDIISDVDMYCGRIVENEIATTWQYAPFSRGVLGGSETFDLNTLARQDDIGLYIISSANSYSHLPTLSSDPADSYNPKWGILQIDAGQGVNWIRQTFTTRTLRAVRFSTSWSGDPLAPVWDDWNITLLTPIDKSIPNAPGGLGVHFMRVGNQTDLYITGTPSSELNTQNAFLELGDVDECFAPIITDQRFREWFTFNKCGIVLINKTSAELPYKLKIGYTRLAATDTVVKLTDQDTIHIKLSYVNR